PPMKRSLVEVLTTRDPITRRTRRLELPTPTATVWCSTFELRPPFKHASRKEAHRQYTKNADPVQVAAGTRFLSSSLLSPPFRPLRVFVLTRPRSPRLQRRLQAGAVHGAALLLAPEEEGGDRGEADGGGHSHGIDRAELLRGEAGQQAAEG